MGEESDKLHEEALYKAYLSMVNTFDKAIMTLSGGALAISLTFIKDIAPDMRSHCWLISSWILFGVSILVILSSFLISQIALKNEIEEEGSGVCWTNATWILNFFAAALFTTGVVLLSVFAGYNLGIK